MLHIANNTSSLKILIDGVLYVVDEREIESTNKQVHDCEDPCVNDYIGDDVLNKIDRITKHIVDQYKDPEAGVSNMEE